MVELTGDTVDEVVSGCVKVTSDVCCVVFDVDNCVLDMVGSSVAVVEDGDETSVVVTIVVEGEVVLDSLVVVDKETVVEDAGLVDEISLNTTLVSPVAGVENVGCSDVDDSVELIVASVTENVTSSVVALVVSTEEASEDGVSNVREDSEVD